MKSIVFLSSVALASTDASSVRGGSNVNVNRVSKPNHAAVVDTAASHMHKRRSLQTTDTNDNEAYWWHERNSDEKDIVYMYDTPPVDESSTSSNNDSNMETHSSALHSKESSPANALDEGTIAYVPLGNGDTMMSSYSAQENTADKSFTVYSVNVDKTPDTSDLPYRQPTRTPTPKPTSSPTDVEIKYYYPIWADNVKGCSSSGEPPSAYFTGGGDYLFDSKQMCCEMWFNGDSICMGTQINEEDVLAMNTDETAMDQYMFEMNGPEAYSAGDGSGDAKPTAPSADTGPSPTPYPQSYSIITSPPFASTTGSPTMVNSTDENSTPSPSASDGTSTTFPPIGITAPLTPLPTPPVPLTPSGLTPWPTYANIPDTAAPQPGAFQITNRPTLIPVAQTSVPEPVPTTPPIETPVFDQFFNPTPAPFGITESPSANRGIIGSMPPVGTPFPTAFTPQPSLTGGNSSTTTPIPTFSGSSSSSGNVTSSPPFSGNTTTPIPTFTGSSSSSGNVTSSPPFSGNTTTPIPTFTGSSSSSGNVTSSPPFSGNTTTPIPTFTGSSSSSIGSNSTTTPQPTNTVTAGGSSVSTSFNTPQPTFAGTSSGNATFGTPQPTNMSTTGGSSFSSSPPVSASTTGWPTYQETTIITVSSNVEEPLVSEEPLESCQGEPCSEGDGTWCRSKHNFCGEGEEYCNKESQWTPDCGTQPPITVAGERMGPLLLTHSTSFNAGFVDSLNPMMTLDVTAGVNGGTLEYEMLSQVFFPVDVVEIDVDGSSVSSVTGIEEWSDYHLVLDAGKHTVTFKYIENPASLSTQALDQIILPSGYEGVAWMDGISYTDA